MAELQIMEDSDVEHTVAYHNGSTVLKCKQLCELTLKVHFQSHPQSNMRAIADYIAKASWRSQLPSAWGNLAANPVRDTKNGR